MNLPCDRDLFDLLVCPVSRRPLKWVGGYLVSTDPASRRRYRVEDGIPVMLPESGQELDQADWEAAMAADGPTGGGVDAVRARQGAAEA